MATYLSFLLYFTYCICLSSIAHAFRQQSVGIRGKLICGSEPLKNTHVKLWNKNHLGTDDQLAAGKTDSDGRYELSGGVGSLFAMNVHFKVYHDCDDLMAGGLVEEPCQRKVNFKISDDWVTRTATPDKWFDGGIMNMAFKYGDEERSCLNKK
uniref:Transthyretin-like family protein n=1 Tax=Ditylenchus dipsaci TaxID=166011 RepID=A0A915EB29_9BILA